MQRVVCDVCEVTSYPQLNYGDQSTIPDGWGSIYAAMTVRRTTPFPEPSQESLQDLQATMVEDLPSERAAIRAARIHRQITGLLQAQRDAWNVPFQLTLSFEVCASCQKDGSKVFAHVEKLRDAELAKLTAPSLRELLFGDDGAPKRHHGLARGFRRMGGMTALEQLDAMHRIRKMPKVVDADFGHVVDMSDLEDMATNEDPGLG